MMPLVSQSKTECPRFCARSSAHLLFCVLNYQRAWHVVCIDSIQWVLTYSFILYNLRNFDVFLLTLFPGQLSSSNILHYFMKKSLVLIRRKSLPLSKRTKSQWRCCIDIDVRNKINTPFTSIFSTHRQTKSKVTF